MSDYIFHATLHKMLWEKTTRAIHKTSDTQTSEDTSFRHTHIWSSWRQIWQTYLYLKTNLTGITHIWRQIWQTDIWRQIYLHLKTKHLRDILTSEDKSDRHTFWRQNILQTFSHLKTNLTDILISKDKTSYRHTHIWRQNILQTYSHLKQLN